MQPRGMPELPVMTEQEVNELRARGVPASQIADLISQRGEETVAAPGDT